MSRGFSEYAAQTIKDSVSALEAGRALGLDPNRDGRCACPMHNGTDRNLKLYPGNKGFHCFVCHEQGDVITLVQRVNGYTFMEAIQWLSETFNMNLDTNTTIDEETRQRAARRAETRRKLTDLHKAAENGAFDAYLNAADTVAALGRMERRHRPTGRNQPFDAAFCTALRLKARAQYLMDEATDLVEAIRW